MELNKVFRLFEFYSGYGGAAFALKKANINFESVGYSEIKPAVIKLYNQNHTGVKNYGDITKRKLKSINTFIIHNLD